MFFTPSSLNYLRLISLFMIVSSLGFNAQAESGKLEEQIALDEMTITATRAETVSSHELPYQINVIEAQEVEQNLVRSLPEALAQTPGIMVQKTANGQGSPFIRGFTGYRTLTLIDGVRYNNAVYRDGPNEYFSLIDIYSIAQIEALNGPASVLYGSDAIGGTLNLQTQHANFNAEDAGTLFIHGRQHYRYASAEASHLSRTELQLGVGQQWGLHLGLSYKHFGDVDAAEIGRQAHTGYDERAYDLRFDWQMSKHWDLSVAHQQLTQDDVWRTHSTQFAQAFAGTEIGSDQRRLKDQDRSLTYLKLRGTDLTHWLDRAQITLSYQRWEEDGDRVRVDGRQNREHFTSAMPGLDVQFSSFTRWGELTYGLDVYEDHIDSRRQDIGADGGTVRDRIQGPVGDDARFLVSGVYAQNALWLTDRLQLTGGLRYSYVEADVGRYEDPLTGAAASYTDSWSNLSAALRASYQLTESGDQLIWAGISQSFRAPNIADVTRFGASRSNEVEVAAIGLEPETFLTYELGYKLEGDRFTLQSTLFYTDIHDFITSTPTGRLIDGQVEVSKQNSAEGYVYGVELAADWQFHPEWALHANLTWMDTALSTIDSLANGARVDEYFSRTMPLTVNASVRWTHPSDNLWASLSVMAAAKADRLSQGDRGDTQRIPPGGTPSYEVIDLRGGWRVNQQVTLIGGLSNLTDEAYRVHGSGSNEPGFGVDVGVSVSF